MSDTPNKIQEFVNFARSLTGYERGEGQEFCVKLFQAFGHKGCLEAGAKLEYRIKSDGQSTKFADLVWRPRLLLEMKSRGEKLEKHHKQVFEYWDELKPKTRYVVLCNFNEFWIYDTQLQIEEPVHRVKLEDLPNRYGTLNFLFPSKTEFNDNSKIFPYENIPPNSVIQFVGREEEVKKLDKLLQQQEGRKIAVIIGMGGVGKTELAKQYALRHIQKCKDTKSDVNKSGVCWIDGREGDIASQIVSFACSFLDLNPPEDWDIPTKVKYCWRNWPKGNWLIVIDDVTNYRRVSEDLPPESSDFIFLLTKREKLGKVPHLQLEILQPQPATDLLKSLIGIQRIEQELGIAEQICNWLGYLPLGLELVGRYLDRDPDLLLKTMLSLLNKKRLRHKSIREADQTMTAKLGVADAFELSWEKLDDNAQELGCMLSLFALADIPWELVQEAYKNLLVTEEEKIDQEIDLDIVEEAKGDLLEFNLLERTGEVTYKLHPLIREFIRYKFENSAKIEDFKQRFLKSLLMVAEQVDDSLTYEQINAISHTIPHLKEIIKNEDLIRYLHNEDLIMPFVALGRFYQLQGLYNEAEKWYEQSLYITTSRFGSGHIHVADSSMNLGNLYHDQGRYIEAENLLTEALNVHKKQLEKNDLRIAYSMSNLANLYTSQSRYNEAEILLVEALDISKYLLGEDNSIVAAILNSLAVLYTHQARYDEAETLHLRVLTFRRQRLGENHLDIANSLNNLSLVYSHQERFDEAESVLVEALRLCRNLLSDNHPKLATSLNNLAQIYLVQERYKEAEDLILQSLDINIRILGDKHPNTVLTLISLAELYKYQCRLNEAEILYLQALELSENLLGGEEDSYTINILNRLGIIYKSQGRYTEAEYMLLKCLDMRRKLLGENHLDLTISMNNLGMFYKSQGRYSEAESLLVQAWQMEKVLLGENHPDVAGSLNNLACLYHDQGLYKKAEYLYIQALELRQNILGKTHSDVAQSLNNLAMLYLDQGHYIQAESLLAKALVVYKKNLEVNNHHISRCEECLKMIRDILKSENSKIPNFKRKSKKGNSQNKAKGFG